MKIDEYLLTTVTLLGAEGVTIKEHQLEKMVVYEVKAPSGEAGKIIGRGGAIANSLKTLMSAIGGAQKKKVIIEILEKQES